MKFNKSGTMKKANDMKLRAVGYSEPNAFGAEYFTILADGDNNSFYMQLDIVEAETIANVLRKYISEYYNTHK